MRGHAKVAAPVVWADHVRIPMGNVSLDGDLVLPPEPRGVVLFAHGSGSSRFSPRNQAIAEVLNDHGFGTLLFDLLTWEEEALEAKAGYLRFDVDLLANRLIGATRWVQRRADTGDLPIGYFGASTGAAAALVATAQGGESVQAVVSRGGRPDLAGAALPQVTTPTLLIVGGRDRVVIELNQQAVARLSGIKELKVVPGATHLFEEPGTLEEVARLATAWFRRHLRGR
ncbi:MAG: dienelactone hydrolase family protein [Verrucomicrobia bacterium]|nr:dienelactone hydrolase family protein [Verrucomicrobiota bacterium]